MKLFGLLIFCLLTVCKSLTGQEFIHEFGIYNPEDFSLKNCSFEPDADAVVIYDIGESSFAESERGYLVIFQRTYKVKILKNSGLEHAEISIPVYTGSQGSELISDLKANSYNYNNGVVEVTNLNPKETFTEKINKNWNLKKFAVPNIKEGTVYDVTYIITSPYIFNLRDWNFQWEIPVIFSQYTTKMHPLIEYSYQLQGRNKFDEFRTYTINNTRLVVGDENQDILAYEFKFKNLPSFPDDEYILAEDYRIKLNFQLSAYVAYGLVVKVITTWPDLLKEVSNHQDFGKYLKTSEKKAEELLSSIDLPDDKEAKIKAIRNWVASNFNYNGTESLFADKPVKDFLINKTGNSAEINLFMNGMLSAAGITATPVIISTRSHGKITGAYPFIDAFNYVLTVAELNGRLILLDATNPLLTYREIPSKCLNEKGLIVNTKEVNWINFASGTSSGTNYSFILNVDPENKNIEEQCNLKITGYTGAKFRYDYVHEYDSLFRELIGTTNADTIRQINLADIEKPFELSYSCTSQLEFVDGKIIIDPFMGKAIDKNPFTQVNRNYPLDFNYKKNYSFESSISIPEGFSLSSKPEELIVENPDIKISYFVNDKEPGIIRVYGSYELKKDVYPADYYTKIKQYFNIIVSRLNEKLVLAPTNNLIK
ncbi:MAG TPA: transglutaminase-like domain-containing protein [Lentimicrobium sp.]|nr:transglutaminase-like domain-containing protein [Lentimicrobium sp.]